MNQLIKEVEVWAENRGLLNPELSSRQALKVMEEVGETMAALARGNRRELKDGIGDSIVTLIILAAQQGMSAEDCLQAAYNEIKDRTGKTVDGVFVKDEFCKCTAHPIPGTTCGRCGKTMK